MKLIASIHSYDRLSDLMSADELLCGVQGLSRLGEISITQLKTIKENYNGRLVLDWNLLMTQNLFEDAVSIYKKASKYVDSVRVTDLGALNYVRENSELPIQLNLEAKGRNLNEIIFWDKFLGKRIERLVLSNEISAQNLNSYVEKVSTPLEILILGPLRLAYTPRRLFKEDGSHSIDSLESLHKNYPIVQNSSGTQMFHIKDLSLIEDVGNLEVEHMRVDLPKPLNVDQLIAFLEGSSTKFNYPRPTTRGFFKSNRSDIIFKKLKNPNIVRCDENYIGDVVEVNKGNYIALAIRSSSVSLKLGDKIHFKTPDSKNKFGKIHFIKNSSGEDLQNAICDQIVLINHVKGVSIRTACYLSCD